MSTGIRPAARVRALPENFFGSLDRAVADARARGVDVIDVSKGDPDLPTPDAIVASMRAAVSDAGNHGYPAYAVRPALAEAIAKRYREDHGVDLDPDVQVAAFHGSHEGLMAAVLSLADPGDVVVVPDPGYPAYRGAAGFAGARPHPVPLPSALGHQPDFASLATLDRAAVLLLNYPHNPTGAVATRTTFERAVAESTRLGAAFVNDFAYSSLGFSARPLSALTVDAERTVEVSTLSKTYNMAGWRIGYAAGAPDLIAAMRAYQAHAFSTIFGATQDAAAAALAGDQSAAEALVDTYRARRDLVVDGLRQQGWDVAPSDGTFFVWVRVGGDDVEVAAHLLAHHGVAVAPGSGFGERGRGRIRLALVHPLPRLADLVARLAAARRTLTATPKPV
ncbi:pyridoxal phosphate-dependent aminotransferase [Microbacterium sp. CIAB417]|uniref:pyridoxal phosphate-dependent aminotransferase n=1 Tax=Microbacterium sp. CIAB417 TaxID=2860287 RepID=UPI001FAB5743|nr:aminotransferase class I/II-fold pyridoxal phosphate-dependent enzyme [Microbacterium sp. CIAB417]